MKRTTAIAAASAVLATLVTVSPPPASATISTSVSGTTITVNASGTETVRFSCNGGSARINGAATSPAVACSALTKVTVLGNSGNQTVFGDGLNATAFTANPSLTAQLGGGADEVTESDRADIIELGAGNDELNLRLPTLTNTSLDLGADSDQVTVRGTANGDSLGAGSNGASLSVSVSNSGGISTYTIGNAEELRLEGSDGNDTVSTTLITAASTVDDVVLSGADGDDELTSGVVTAQLQGGAGTNELNGGAANDTIVTSSETDVINPGAGTNRVLDATSLRSGGRTVSNGGSNSWYLGHYPGDSVARIRPGTVGGSSKIIASLTRPGIQQLGTSFDEIEVQLNAGGEPQSASIVDVIAVSGTAVTVSSNNVPKEILDITIPTGSWSTTTVGFNWVIDPSAAGYPNIEAFGFTSVNVHGPFASTNQGYAHRVIRDLLFRIPGPSERDQLRDDLDDNVKTPTTAVRQIMDTDEYRGLDVDRVFVKYLRRVADPGGRSYWVNSLDDGKALWRFRAQLFGSNEYFTKAGGTNAAYVTRAYSDVLGRTPDPSGQTFWTNKLNNGADRGQVALQFMNSAEARRRLVDDQFLRFLERYPTPTEQTFWVGQIPTATGEIDLIRTLATTSSYYQFD